MQACEIALPDTVQEAGASQEAESTRPAVLEYRPLIYTVVQGDDLSYRCLVQLVASLRSFGRFSGEVVAFSDRSEADVLSLLPDGLRSNLIVKSIVGDERLQKYDISGLPAGRCPILYVGAGIVADDDINPIFRRIFENPGIHVATEREFYPDIIGCQINEVEDVRNVGNWWGFDLLKSDDYCREDLLLGASSGLIGCRDRCLLEILGRSVVEGYANEIHAGIAKSFGDQPFFNYALVKSKSVAVDPLDDCCQFVRNAPGGVGDRRGFVHFVWANDRDRPVQMANYMATLKKTGMQRALSNASAERNARSDRSFSRLETCPYIFVITSAIFPDSGVLDIEDRIYQTLETIRSIKERVPAAGIVISDSSRGEIPGGIRRFLQDEVDMFLEMGALNPGLSLDRAIGGSWGKKDYVKSLSETWALSSSFFVLATTLKKISASRIFKISGRYRLSKDFDISCYEGAEVEGKYVLKRPGAPWFNGKGYYETRLWSLPTSLLKETTELMARIFFYTIERQLVAEQSYFANVPKESVVEFETIGVEGQIASSGVYVIE